ncbi:hypothetical protein D3P08_01390 [Paenibacillus nanensis]|uniref:DUF2140 family protein n=2 Tax=Paenibacillus nanensis TaxID=393251 RepID=A0A3A1VID0_9BACL|nr:hypothetical protein D3P08_01390 [Paenibacillus nanensis]
MGRVFKRLFITLVVLVIIVGGAIWGLLRYIAPDQQLNLNYSPIDVKQKALDMVKELKPELVLTEEDVNNLIKKHLDPIIKEDVRVEGAKFHLVEDRMIADLNVTYRQKIPAQIRAEYGLKWEDHQLILEPKDLSLKSIRLPSDILEKVSIPIDLPADEVISIKDVKFETGQIRVKFHMKLPF